MQKSTIRPSWLDEKEYPFKSHCFDTNDGRIHYIDEGEGEVLLFVHGTPSWSFLYRKYIKALRDRYRCIALDHLGFGLSDKPDDVVGTPEFHSKNLTALIKKLDLNLITLVAHDFGGPIGLGSAISNPDRFARVVLFNTWLWGTKADKNAQRINNILHSWLGNTLYLHTNFSPNILFKKAFFNQKLLSTRTHQHYRKPFPNKGSRHGLLQIGKALVGSSDWYERQWQQIATLRDKPFLLLWGNKDPFIKMEYLTKWMEAVPNAVAHTFEAGHFVQEEKMEESLEKLEAWLERNRAN